MLVSGHGQIKFLEIPDDWLEQSEHHGPDAMTGARSLIWYQHPENIDVKIGLLYRGMPLVEEGSKEAHRAVLDLPEHELTPKEIDSISEVLLSCYSTRAYDMHFCKSVDRGGRRIITVEGIYRESQLRTIEYFIDGDGTGSCVQQVYFQAPVTVFDRHEPEGRYALESIEFLHLDVPLLDSIKLPDGLVLTGKSSTKELLVAITAKGNDWKPTEEEEETLYAWLKTST